MNEKTRKILKKTLFTVLVLSFILGIFRITFLETREQNIYFGQVNTLADEQTHTQDQYILLTEIGGVKTFPFVWSEVLYLYNIEEKKKSLVDIAMIPSESYGHYFIIGNDVYFEKSILADSPNLKRKNLKTGEVEQLDISSQSFIAMKDALLYCDSLAGGAHSLNLYKDGITEVLIPKGVEDIVSTGIELYWFQESETTLCDVYEYNWENRISSRLGFPMEHIGWIYKMDESEYLFVDQCTLYKWDDKTKIKKALSEAGEVEYDVCYKDGIVYYKKEDQTIVALNPITEASQTFIDAKDYIEKGDSIYIDSIECCEDYIGVFVSEEKGNKSLSTVLIFDYEGNLLCRV